MEALGVVAGSGGRTGHEDEMRREFTSLYAGRGE